MNRQIRPAPVRKTIHVDIPPERAFDVFTKNIGQWWPKSHKVSQADLERPVIEPFNGGRWYELGVDGAQCDVGKVLAWEPPRRVLLAWQLDQDWTFDPELITEVEVSFAPEGEGTRVSLEHRNLGRLGDHGEAVRKRIDSPDGWGLLLKLYSETAAK